MAITYPTALDAFINPTGTSLLTSPNHAQQHSDLNDAVEALEAKVAIGATVLGTYTAFTPTFFNLTVGNAVIESAYCRVNNFVHYYGTIALGTTSSVTGSVVLTLPINCASVFSNQPTQFGFAGFRDVSAGVNLFGAGNRNDASSIVFAVTNVAGTYSTTQNVNATVPFIWTTSDTFFWNLYYKAA